MNPTHCLNADADKNRTLHPLHSGDASILTSVRWTLATRAEIHSRVTKMVQMRRQRGGWNSSVRAAACRDSSLALPAFEDERLGGAQEPMSRSNFKMTGRRTIIKITGKMPKASGIDHFYGQFVRIFLRQQHSFGAHVFAEFPERRGDVAAELDRMPQDRDKGRRLLQSQSVRESAQGVDRASSRAHFGPHQFDVAAKRPASLHEPIADSLERRLHSETGGDAHGQQVQKIGEIEAIFGDLPGLAARQIGVRPEDPDPDGGRRGQHKLQS